MENNEKEQYRQEDEIDLADIVKVLWNRRKLIIFGTIIITVL